MTFHGLDEVNGISKKIRFQVKALNDCGVQTELCHCETTSTGEVIWKINNKILKKIGIGYIAKFKRRVDFRPIIQYIKQNSIQFVYIRSFHNASPFLNRFLKVLKKEGIITAMEIPTFPYDQEFTTFRMKIELLFDRIYRKKMAKLLTGIVTFSDEKNIFGGNTINISNGIDFDAIPLKKRGKSTTNELHLIAVAEIHYWHGFDRLINGLIDYYSTNPTCKVYFHLVGEFSGPREKKEIMNAINKGKLDPYVIRYGLRSGKELDELFEKADFAIGSLARHRSGISKIKTLKNREYAARGIPFAYSESDSDFDNQPYIIKIPSNETPIEIKDIIAFNHSLKMTPKEIRASVYNLSWKNQMQMVINQISKYHA